jgi:hypothetical protein
MSHIENEYSFRHPNLEPEQVVDVDSECEERSEVGSEIFDYDLCAKRYKPLEGLRVSWFWVWLGDS